MFSEPSAVYRLKLTTPRWVNWYSEPQVLTEDQALTWVEETLAGPVGQYVKQAEYYDPENNEWRVF